MTPNQRTPIALLSGSGWIDRPSSIEEPVAGCVTCDVVVVGGGLGGMTAALALAEAGRDVVLLEADLCGWGASSRNAGYLTNTLGSDPRVLARFYADRVRPLYRFANNAVVFTEDLIADRGIECGYEKTGTLSAAPTAAAFKRMVKSTKSGRRVTVGDARELGIPPSFYGGIHVRVGGTLNPGELALGLRDVLRTSDVRVFEQSPALDVRDEGDSVVVRVPGGMVRAGQAILATNAATGDFDVAPRNLSKPVWVTAVETEPVSTESLELAGWTSRTPITTSHLVMQSFRTTPRSTIVFTTRRLQITRKPSAARLPDTAVVNDLVRGFRERFPTLGDVAPERGWGGWIGLTPSNLAVVGRATPRIYYSMACNGHGLPQAPYLGSLLARHVAGQPMHDDLRAVWRESARFAPGIVNRATLRLGWVADRFGDRIDRLRNL